MKTSLIGQTAEQLVAEYLLRAGHMVLECNWRQKRCEIDIISRKKGIVYFTEVKFRSSNFQGDGMEYITASKLKQMEYGAALWSQQNGWRGDCRLMAAAVGRAEGMMVIKEIIEL